MKRVAFVLVLAACGDIAGAPGRPQAMAVASCVADRTEVRCSTLPAGARGNLYGSNGVKITSGTPTYNSATWLFEFDVSVKDLLSEAMGTEDGCAPDGQGVAVFFASNPPLAVTGGSGSAEVYNADGIETFTATNQPYYRYIGFRLGVDEVLSPGETSLTRHWAFLIEPTVTSFAFTLYASANVAPPC